MKRKPPQYISPEAGDVIMQQRLPGGQCLLVEVFDAEEDYNPGKYYMKDDQRHCIWGEADWPIYRILHPVEGLIDDPSYYYTTIELALWHEKRELTS